MDTSLIDTHCHIQSAGLDLGERSTQEMWAKAGSSIDEIVTRAHEAGVAKMICVGCDVGDSVLAVDCVKTRENLFASIGIHPHEAMKFVNHQEELDRFAQLLTKPKVVAIGECGLDYFYEHSPREEQIKILEFQLDLAQKHNLPLIFHVREAFEDFWPIFDNFKGLRGVLHSFTDNHLNMQKAVQKGLYIGVNGIATFAKQPEQLNVYKTIPPQHLLLETDAPFLTPVPLRGTICEPRHVVLTAEFLSSLRGDTVAEISRATTRNAENLFGI
jgi:TatD DNase family protein